jgi:hypothetical protein
MGASIPRFWAWILRTAGQLVMKKRKVLLLKKKIAIEFWGCFFVDGFLIYYFQTSYLCALEIERK